MYMPRDKEMLGEGKKWTEGKGESSKSCKARENGNIMALPLMNFHIHYQFLFLIVFTSQTCMTLGN
jgi:hypothetical protein